VFDEKPPSPEIHGVGSTHVNLSGVGYAANAAIPNMEQRRNSFLQLNCIFWVSNLGVWSVWAAVAVLLLSSDCVYT